MNKVKFVLFSVSISLALGFTFGCSSDSPSGPNGGESSPSPKPSSSSAYTPPPPLSSSSSVVVGTQYYDAILGFWSASCPSLNDYPELLNNVTSITDNSRSFMQTCLIEPEYYTQNTGSQIADFLATNGLSGYANEFDSRIAASSYKSAYLIYTNTNNYFRILIIGYSGTTNLPSSSSGQSSSSIYIPSSPTCNLACVESTIDAMMSATRDNYVCKYGISSETTLKISDSCKCPSADVYAVKNRLCNVSSSSSMPSSSSNVPLSSSSLAQSSSSVEVFSSSSMTSSSSSEVTSVGYCEDFVDGTPREHYGKNKAQFCDSRDGQKYVYVEIGTQTWMAENLAYDVSGSQCYKCPTYGRSYNWPMAITEVCPYGWHLPNIGEWNTLINFAGGQQTAGNKLKATSGWNNNGSQSGNGTDDLGFSALPGGINGNTTGLRPIGSYGNWWVYSNSTADKSAALIISLTGSVETNISNTDSYNYINGYFLSIRCLKD